MPKLSRVTGSTSQVLTLFVQDTTVGTGAGLTGLAFNSAGLTCYAKRNLDPASVAVTLATITTLGVYAAGGFKAVDAANMPGVYEFHPPDAGYAAGARSVVYVLKGAANMATVLVEVDLTAVDTQEPVRMGMTGFPNAATGTNGAVVTQGSGVAQLNCGSGNVTLASGTHAGAVIPTVTTVTTPPALAAAQAFNNTGQATNLPANVAQWAGSTVAAPNTPGVPRVDLTQINGVAAAAVAGAIDANLTAVNGTAFAGASAPADVVRVAGMAASAAAPVAFPAAVGTSTFAGGAVASVAAPVAVAGTVSATLVATGLDAVSVADEAGVPATFRGMLLWLVRGQWAGSLTATARVVKKADGTTQTTQAVSDDGTTQTIAGPT